MTSKASSTPIVQTNTETEPPSKSHRGILALARTAAKYREARLRMLATVASNNSNRKKHAVPDLGFHFSPEDYYRIYLACLDAEQFIRNYGKDAPRANQRQIDLTHYLQ